MNFQNVLNKQKLILDAIGIKNRITMGSGIFVLEVDKGNSAPIRKAFKNKCGIVTEVRGKEMTSFVWLDDTIQMSRKEIKSFVQSIS